MEEFDAERYLDSALEGPVGAKDSANGRESRNVEGDGSDSRRKSRRSGSRENR